MIDAKHNPAIKKEIKATKVKERDKPETTRSKMENSNKKEGTVDGGDNKKLSKKERRALKVQGRPKNEVVFSVKILFLHTY